MYSRLAALLCLNILICVTPALATSDDLSALYATERAAEPALFEDDDEVTSGNQQTVVEAEPLSVNMHMEYDLASSGKSIDSFVGVENPFQSSPENTYKGSRSKTRSDREYKRWHE